MVSLSVRFFASVAVLVSVLLLSGCDDGSSSSGGDALNTLVTAHEDSVDGTSDSKDGKSTPETQSLDLSSNESEEQAPAKTAAAPAATAKPATTSNQKARGNFDLTFKQTVMPCASCGIWFDSVELVIQHTEGTYKQRQGTMFVKKASGKVGHFKANLSSIPAGAKITRATLYMRLHPHEGIANGDNGSVIAVTDGSSRFVRNITAKNDIKGKGYHKGNPNVPIDFTAYAKRL